MSKFETFEFQPTIAELMVGHEVLIEEGTSETTISVIFMTRSLVRTSYRLNLMLSMLLLFISQHYCILSSEYD